MHKSFCHQLVTVVCALMAVSMFSTEFSNQHKVRHFAETASGKLLDASLNTKTNWDIFPFFRGLKAGKVELFEVFVHHLGDLHTTFPGKGGPGSHLVTNVCALICLFHYRNYS